MTEIYTLGDALNVLPMLDPDQFTAENYAGTLDGKNAQEKSDISFLKNCTPLGWQTKQKIGYPQSMCPHVILLKHDSGFTGWTTVDNITIMFLAEEYQKALTGR